MFKTELHAHTSPVSQCAQSTPPEEVDAFLQNGYSTLVITNHMSPPLFDMAHARGLTQWREIADLYLSDYRTAKEYAGDRLTVLLGMEVRLYENNNDYLVYGIDEDFVVEMGDVMGFSVRALSDLVHSRGGLIYQAHPFRVGMTITDPGLLDGVETANCCKDHNSRNDIARRWAEKHDLLQICGSDYHRPSHMSGAGILTEEKITDEKALLSVLKTMNFQMQEG